MPQWIIWVFIGGQAALMSAIIIYLAKIKKENTSESYLTAGRSVGLGLASASIVAEWTWAATIMVASQLGYVLGFSGAFWYALAATLPFFPFALLALKLKQKFPQARSFPEFFYYRFDKKNHILLSVFGFIVALMVSIMIVVGGGITIYQFSGMDPILAMFLIVLAFSSYTVIGGLYGTVFSDAMQGLLIYVVFGIVVVGMAVTIGPQEIYNGLLNMVQGNNPDYVSRALENGMTREALEDSLSILSVPGFVLGIGLIISNFPAVFVEQAFWGRSIAVKDTKIATRAFIIGGLAWFPIPAAVGLALGTGGVALGMLPAGTSPDFVAPATVQNVLGMTGMIAFLFGLIAAMLSTGSGELNAASTIFSNDLYRRYFKPNASDSQILRAARIFGIVFAIGVLGTSIAVFKLGLSMLDVYLAMGVFVGSACVPIFLGMLWKRCSADGSFYGTIVGAVLAVIIFLIYGEIPATIAAVVVSTIITVVLSFVQNNNYDFDRMIDIDVNKVNRTSMKTN
ncbi:Sodium/glucose cotransporter (plasmid) [Peribacillus frigoritolerans]